MYFTQKFKYKNMKRIINIITVIIFSFAVTAGFSQTDNKDVFITVSGSGKNIGDAKQVALRSAIEQAFGAFISSKTEMFNDNIVVDEMVSVSNGSVKSYEILNEFQIPNGDYSITLKVLVSLDKLTSFVQSKGKEVQVMGDLFAMNIKQQMLNEEAEFKLINDMTIILNEPMQLSFDYQIKSDTPKSLDHGNNNWSIPLEITATVNKNMDFCAEYTINTLSAIGLSPEEVNDYKKLNKNIYTIHLIYSNKNYTFYLRNKQSLLQLYLFVDMWESYLYNFEVKSGLGEISKNLNNKQIHFFANDNYDGLEIDFLSSGQVAGNFKWEDLRTLDQIAKINGYKVNSKGAHIKFISELSYIKNLISQLESNISEPFDYNIVTGKISVKDGKYCILPTEIIIKSNLNFYNLYLKLTKEIEEISFDAIYKQQSEKKYPIEINSNIYYLRYKESVEQIEKLYSKILSKIDDYIVVDGCLKEINLNQISKVSNLHDYKIFFPNTGFIAKTLQGNYSTSIEEIGSLEQIKIFSGNKLLDFKKGNLINRELKTLKYSETNPIDFFAVRNNLLKTLESLTKDKKNGNINVNYNFKFSGEGINKSSLEQINVSSEKFKQVIESNLNSIKLNPSKLCGNFTATSDSINFNFKWETYSSKNLYEKGRYSTYLEYFKLHKLPYGTYTLIEIDKKLNNQIYKDISISNFTTRGPINSIYSLILPGWGTRRVSYGEKKGWNRFALVVTPLALAVASKLISNSYYDKYLNASNQPDIDRYYNYSNTLNKSTIVLSTIGATFYVYDFIWVLGKGFGNIFQKYRIKSKIKSSNPQIQYQQLN